MLCHLCKWTEMQLSTTDRRHWEYVRQVGPLDAFLSLHEAEVNKHFFENQKIWKRQWEESCCWDGYRLPEREYSSSKMSPSRSSRRADNCCRNLSMQKSWNLCKNHFLKYKLKNQKTFTVHTSFAQLQFLWQQHLSPGRGRWRWAVVGSTCQNAVT